MKVSQAMWDKASRLIAADAAAASRAAGNGPGKRHQPYSIPERARALVAALGKDDAETVASIMMHEYTLSGRSDPLSL